MKTTTRLKAVLALSIAAFAPSLFAQLTIPGADGSDGALNITSNTVIDLSQAVTGVWSNNNSGNAGKGIYDPSKWAVVFKYSSVNIAIGATVTFKNHPSTAPLVWLVNGSVTINGILSLNGQTEPLDTTLAEPGPGGFRGGAIPIVSAGLSRGAGFGPGGRNDTHGLYSSYGNPQIIPLIGGSGGSGYNLSGAAGSAGGGAVLIGASGLITVNGTCRANGGSTVSGWGGSGGAIRLVADQILGFGFVSATSVGGANTAGRIRLEANLFSPDLTANPTAVAVTPIPGPITVWPETNSARIRVVSVDGRPAPADPRAGLSNAVDVVIATNNTTVVLETANFPTNGVVSVFVTPRHGSRVTYQASHISGTTILATWQVQTNLPLNYSVIQARAVSP